MPIMTTADESPGAKTADHVDNKEATSHGAMAAGDPHGEKGGEPATGVSVETEEQDESGEKPEERTKVQMLRDRYEKLEGEEVQILKELKELAEMVAELNKELNHRMKEVEREKQEMNQRIEAIGRDKAQVRQSVDQITHYLQELIRARKIRARILLAIQLREYHDLLAENQSAN